MGLLFLGLFVFVAREVGAADDWLKTFDATVLQRIADWRGEHLTATIVELSALGSFLALAIVAVLGIILMGMAGDGAGAWQLTLVGITTAIVNDVAKAAFARARPDVVPKLAPVWDLSFPSGHSFGSAAIYLTLALLAARFFKKSGQRVTLFVLAGALIAAIGWSRLYLGVHYPSDVLGGFCLGAGCAFLFGSVFAYARRRVLT